jgi:hypothetical protein
VVHTTVIVTYSRVQRCQKLLLYHRRVCTATAVPHYDL